MCLPEDSPRCFAHLQLCKAGYFRCMVDGRWCSSLAIGHMEEAIDQPRSALLRHNYVEAEGAYWAEAAVGQAFLSAAETPKKRTRPMCQPTGSESCATSTR